MSEISQLLREGPADSALAFRAADEIERLTPYVEAFRREETRADKLAQQVDELREQLVKRAETLKEIVRQAKLALSEPILINRNDTLRKIVAASEAALSDEHRQSICSRCAGEDPSCHVCGGNAFNSMLQYVQSSASAGCATANYILEKHALKTAQGEQK